MVLPIGNIINVSLTGTPSGLQERNVNNVALFTTEAPSNTDVFRTYISAQQVIADYGTSSVTGQMANAIFSQTPNILTGRGRVVVIPMLNTSTSATVGDFTTADISGNLSNLIGVGNGDLRVTVNGTNIDLTGLDFTAATTMDGVASVLQVALPNTIVEAVAETGIKITAKKVGLDSDIVLAAHPSGAGTDIAGSTFLNVSAGTATSGANASGETLVDAIARVSGDTSFTGVITNLEMEDAVISTTALSIQATDRIFVHHFASTEDIAGIATTISSATQTQTRPVLYTTSMAAANIMKAAYAGRGFSVNFNGSNTSQTLNLKPLSGITPDEGINQTNYTAAKVAGIDMYVSIAGVPSVASTGGNDYFDNIYSDIALKFALEAAGFNHLRQTNTKVPQTEPGISGLSDSYERVLVRFVNAGVIGVGLTWNSSETFGDPEDLREAITQQGYFIYSLPIALQSQSEREQRIAPLIQIAVKRAGAIHSSDVLVVIED